MKEHKKFKLAKIASGIPGFAKLTQQLEDRINKIESSSKSPSHKDVKETEGESGDVKVTKDEDGNYELAVRTEDGWKIPMIGETKIKLKDKKKLEKKKDIEEISDEDEEKGSKKAEKSIYDEKNDKFSIDHFLTPTYDSGWFSAETGKVYTTGGTNGVKPNDSSVYTGTASVCVGINELGFTMDRMPLRWSLYIANSSVSSWSDVDGTSDSWVMKVDSNTDRSIYEENEAHTWGGSVVWVTSSTHVSIVTPNDYILMLHDGEQANWPGPNQAVTSCKMKLLVWK